MSLVTEICLIEAATVSLFGRELIDLGKDHFCKVVSWKSKISKRVSSKYTVIGDTMKRLNESKDYLEHPQL